MIRVFMTGNLCADPEIGTTSNGINFTRVNVAVNTGTKDQDNNYVTNFYNCTAWRHTAEYMSKFVKGQKVAIVGSLLERKYNDQQGIERRTYNVNIDNVESLGRPNTENVTPPAYGAAFPQRGADPNLDNDDLPF